MVAIIFPLPNFFLALGMTEEISGGAAEPLPLSAGGVAEVPSSGSF
jgi:hypothetical protein